MITSLSLAGVFRKTATVCFLAAAVSACQLSPTPDITGIRAYQAPAPQGTDGLIRRHDLLGAKTGYVLYDLDTGETLAARNENQLFIPASTAKVPTTLAALNILGPDYRFHTRLLGTGNIDTPGGVLKGDLYLQGGGAPLLRVADLMGLAQKLKDSGVSTITGKFHFDQSQLGHTLSIEPSQPDNARYNPGVSALSLDFNHILRSPAARGGRDEYLPVKNPAPRTAKIFRRLAAMIGVDLPAPEETPAPTNARALARVSGLPLFEIVRLALEHSNNLVTELIGQVAARRLTGKTGGGKTMTLARSAETLTRWLQGRMTATNWVGFSLPNHSGLTSKARVTPTQMASIIRFDVPQRFQGESYLSLMPVSGQRDSMRKRFRDPPTALRLWAKTGTLKYAKGLTGVLYTRRGRRVAFALYVTDFGKRSAYDADTRRHSPAATARADGWIDRAEALESDLVREWILNF